MVDVAFYLVAVITIAAAIIALEAKDIVYGAVALALSFLGIAGFFILLDAPFLAMFQIMIYVGAIAVLILFTVMLVKREKWLETKEGVNKTAGLVATLIIAIAMGFIIFQSGLGGIVPPPEAASFTKIGVQILSEYWPVFMVLAFVLTAAVFGAIVLAKQERG